jgi:putative Mn2+ efflux pump MntP
VIFLLVGLGGIVNLAGEIVGAVVLVGIGVVSLFRALRRS